MCTDQLQIHTPLPPHTIGGTVITRHETIYRTYIDIYLYVYMIYGMLRRTHPLPPGGHGLYPPCGPVVAVGGCDSWFIRVVVFASAFHPMVFAGDSLEKCG